MALFRGLNEQGMTVVLVTHEADIAAYARRVVRMRDGQVLSDIVNDLPIPEAVPAAAGAWA
jgi:putative ABC transport system ATP-binding protein